MTLTQQNHKNVDRGVQPLCPVFGECLGCLYQNIDYANELSIKEGWLKELFKASPDLDLPDDVYRPIVPSPRPYHYRNRLDLKLKRTKEGEVFIGFTPENRRGVLPVDACFIADQHISDFIPEVKTQAIDQLPPKYKIANLVVRTGDDGRVFWGGIGRRSCQLPEEDYLWTEIGERRIFYSLDTFFQANLSILPKLFDVIRSLSVWETKPVLYDLYGGVGLFGISLLDQAEEVILIEENPASLKLACYNAAFNKARHFKILEGRIEDQLPGLLERRAGQANVAMIDPPRAGLSERARDLIGGARSLKNILYLSCNPESLARDLSYFARQGWCIERVVPFDFFPKTKHLEVLVLLNR